MAGRPKGSTNKKKKNELMCECKEHKGKNPLDIKNFYSSKSPLFPDGRVHICKKCLMNMIDYDDMNTIYSVLQILDIAFYVDVWDKVYNANSNRSDKILGLYIKEINLGQFDGKRYKDSIFEKKEEIEERNKAINNVEKCKKEIKKELTEEDLEKEVIYKQNKQHIMKVLGYDPFEYEDEENRPKMFAKLCNMLTDDIENDTIKIGAVLDIIKIQNQTEKIDSAIVSLNKTSQDIIDNMSSVSTLTKTKGELTKQLNSIVKEHNMSKKNSAGANTFSGKEQKMKDLDLEAIQVNLYDQLTAEGMQQVSDMSLRSAIRELNFGDDTLSEIVKEQTKLIDNFRKQYNDLREENRRLKALCVLNGIVYREYILNEEWAESLEFNEELKEKQEQYIKESEKKVIRIKVDKYADEVAEFIKEKEKRKIMNSQKNT